MRQNIRTPKTTLEHATQACFDLLDWLRWLQVHGATRDDRRRAGAAYQHLVAAMSAANELGPREVPCNGSDGTLHATAAANA